MLVHFLVIIGFWFSSSAADDQVLTELKKISDAKSAGDGQGRLMRLRTCRAYAWMQCELCEEIRIVNASYAASRARLRIDGCSEVNFDQEFDCLIPGYSPYLQELKENCSGTQSCKSQSRRAVFDCGSLVETNSCCLEIFYTCEQRTDVTLSFLFIANNTAGYVRNVSLQCQSSDLSVDSVVLAFNSSGEFHEGGICYRLSSNKEHVAKHCNRKGCSNVLVPGERGCGENPHIFNYGAYIYYICGHNQQDQCQRPAETPTVQSKATLLASVAQESSSVGYTSFVAVVIGGLCAIVISNIIVALGVRKYYLRKAKDSSNSDETETKQYQDLASTQRQANPDFTYTELQLQPVYEEVSKRGQ